MTSLINGLIEMMVMARGRWNLLRSSPGRCRSGLLQGCWGFPLEDVDRLAAWGSAQVMQYVYGKGHMNQLGEEETALQAQRLDGFADYLASQVASKRANPQDDMISALTQIHYQALDRKLTDEEVYGIVYFMILGGLETTQYALEEEAQLLCEQPGLFDTLKSDAGKIRAFTEEAMRLRAPTQGLSTRVTTREEVFQGVVCARWLHTAYPLWCRQR